VTGNVNTGVDGEFNGTALAFVGGSSSSAEWQEVVWVGTPGVKGSGIWGNIAPDHAALELYGAVDFEADTLDFGSVANGTGNTDLDIEWTGLSPASEYWVDYDDASFSCAWGVCGSAVTTVPLSLSSSYNANSMTTGYGTVFTVDSTGTLNTLEIFATADTTGCSMELSLLSTTNVSSGVWDVEWMSSPMAMSTKGSWLSSSTLGDVLDQNKTYAFVWDNNGCWYTAYWAYESNPTTITGLGEAPGSYVANCYPQAEGTTVSCPVNQSWLVDWYVRFNVTQL
jgi:hypothetical protein